MYEPMNNKRLYLCALCQKQKKFREQESVKENIIISKSITLIDLTHYDNFF